MSDTTVVQPSPVKTAARLLRRSGAIILVLALAWWVLFVNTNMLPELIGYGGPESTAAIKRFTTAVRGAWLPYEPAAFWVGALAFALGGILDPLGLSADVDHCNEKIGNICNWLVLWACVISAGNAMVRYAYDNSSNAWLEVQWYMFAVMVMFGAAYTLKRNEHVRVDLLYMTVGRRGQLWIDILGTLVFLLPTCAILAWLSWPFFAQSYTVLEHSSNAGGLIRWPIKLVLPIGFALVALQGISELIKRVAFLNDIPVESLEAHYERPTQ
jgi:TRAP-type mannitol/chloroaromatic compound transport system permease small subunit